MPKGPQGQKRPADTVGSAVKVSQIAMGEVSDEAEFTASEKGSSGCKARAKRLSSEQRQSIARATAQARWNEERRVSMTQQERLMTALFENPHREHVDIKFWLGGGIDVTSEDLCREAANMLEQMDRTEGDATFSEDFPQREVVDFIASI